MISIFAPLFKKKSLIPKEPKPRWKTSRSATSYAMLGGKLVSYDEIYRTHGAVSSVINFLSGNFAEASIHAYQRSANNVERMPRKDPLESLLRRPNRITSGHEWRRDLVTDVALHGNHFSIKVRNEDDGRIAALVRCPPSKVTMERRDTTEPAAYVVQFDAEPRTFPAEDVFHVRTYSPDGLLGVSPLEALRSVLSEDAAAVENREVFWRQGARIGGWVTRPLDAPPLTGDAFNRYVEEWRSQVTGEANTGKTAFLQEGAEYHPDSTNPRDSEFTAGRRLVFEIVCSIYGVPSQLLGLGESRNYDAATRGLVLHCLSPWFSLVEESINRDLVPDIYGDQAFADRIFTEFTVEEKARGSFAAQAKILEAATGGPWLTPNETRKMYNLKPVKNGDDLLLPRSVVVIPDNREDPE